MLLGFFGSIVVLALLFLWMSVKHRQRISTAGSIPLGPARRGDRSRPEHEAALALQGLTADEARFPIGRALAADHHLGEASLQALREEKHLLVDRSGIIRVVADRTDIEHVGRLETLKKWLSQRRSSSSFAIS
jgi:hypothetical protein